MGIKCLWELPGMMGISSFSNRFIFKSSFRLTTKLSRRQRFPCCPSRLHPINSLHQVMFVIIDELALTPQYQLKSIVYIAVYS